VPFDEPRVAGDGQAGGRDRPDLGPAVEVEEDGPGAHVDPVGSGQDRGERGGDDHRRKGRNTGGDEDPPISLRFRRRGRERSQDLRRVPALGRDPRDADRFRQSLEMDRAAVDGPDAVDRPG